MSLIATLICHPARPALNAKIANAAQNCVGATEISWLAETCALDLSLPQGMAQAEAFLRLQKLIGTRPIDFAIQDSANRRKKALIADMDSTMIDQECIDELAAELDLKQKVAAITARAMNGEIEFEPALRERVALLEGLSASIVNEVIKNRITLASGAKTLLATMKAAGAHTALVSGGFTLFTEKIATLLGFDENQANILEVKNDKFTGRVVEPILGRQAKVDALERIAAKHRLMVDEFIAVGDGANDLGMIARAGSGVALHAKPAVAAQAQFRIDHGDLTALLYLQGYSQSEFVG